MYYNLYVMFLFIVIKLY